MNGYLMQEQDWVAGQDLFIESFSPENHFGVVFEDDGEAAYFYAIEKDGQGEGMHILDALHIYESADREEGEASAEQADRDDRADQKGRLDQQERLEQEEPATRQKPANRENRANQEEPPNLEEPPNQEKRLEKKEAGHLPPAPANNPLQNQSI